jgi:flavodoxin I
MKVLVVYDTTYGNTEKIGRAITEAVGDDVRTLQAGETGPSDLEGIDLLFIGAPTQGGRPTRPTQDLLKKLSDTDVKGLKIATYDTRISAKWVGIFGYAAGRIAKALKKKGGNLVRDPEPFFVTGTEGPLREGETERATAWAKEVISSL